MDEPTAASAQDVRRRWPWATMCLSMLALVAAGWPAVGDALIYERAAILRGELWRLWTGHAAHLGWSHLVWNLAVFISAGAWLERVAPRATRWFCALAPAAISAGLFVFLPDLARYAGLSALATGLVVLLALDRLRAGGREPRWVWWAVLALVAAKALVETLNGGAVFASLEGGARVVPLAHALGIVGAVAANLGGRSDRNPT